MATSKARTIARENTVESLLVDEEEEEAKGLTVREKVAREGREEEGSDAGLRAERDEAPARPASACCPRETPRDAHVTQRPKSALDSYDLRRRSNDTVFTLTSSASETTRRLPTPTTTSALLQTALRSFDLLSHKDDSDLIDRDFRSTLRDLLNMQQKIMTRVGRLELNNGFG